MPLCRSVQQRPLIIAERSSPPEDAAAANGGVGERISSSDNVNYSQATVKHVVRSFSLSGDDGTWQRFAGKEVM